MTKANEGRILIEVDEESKNSHTFENGMTIRLERRYNNFDRKYVQPINAKVIEGDNIANGTEILVHHNALSDTNKVHNYVKLSGDQIASSIQYYSIPIEMAFAWLQGENWKPCTGFAFGYRIFKPYKGILQGIVPAQLKNVLYCYTGELSGKVVQTVHSADYEIIFQGLSGREERLIRFRHFEDEDNPREEVQIVRDDLTEEVLSDELHIGISIADATTLTHKTETKWQISQ